MKFFDYIKYILVLVALCSAISCSEKMGQTPLPEVDTDKFPSDAVRGELLINFSEEACTVLEKVLPQTKGAQTRSGLVSVDEVLSLVNAYQLERVFPVNSKTEEKTRQAGLHRWYVIRFDENLPLEEVAAQFAGLGEVKSVNCNHYIKKAYSAEAQPLSVEMLRTLSQPRTTGFNDPELYLQWNLVNTGSAPYAQEPGFEVANKFIAGADVQAEKAWELCTGHEDIIVAVLDEGVCLTHEDLRANIWTNEGEIYGSNVDADGNGYAGDAHGWNFVHNIPIITWDDINDSGHGTHVAGVIAAQNNNGVGVSSIAGGTTETPGVKIMTCQLFAGAASATALTQVQAMKYAADNGAVIMQCSWGYVSALAEEYVHGARGYESDEQWEMYSPLEKVTLDYFMSTAGSASGPIDGGIAVFASGNERAGMAAYPGCYEKIVCVTATASDFTPSDHTNYGKGVNIAAPGGDQDYYYEWGTGRDRGTIGCILSTLPEHVSPTGYGYMEGTSMATPHVSGVLALGLSYAAQQRKHFTADEIKELLYANVTPIDNYMTGKKVYYHWVTDLEDNCVDNLDLKLYKNKMGVGQVNAYKFLQAIGGSGQDMTFPNVCIGEGESTSVKPSTYFKGGESLTYSVSVENTAIATAVLEGNKVTIQGVKEGVTKASVSAGSVTQEFVITVRNNAGNGWL